MYNIRTVHSPPCCACVRACVRACVLACVRACVRICSADDTDHTVFVCSSSIDVTNPVEQMKSCSSLLVVMTSLPRLALSKQSAASRSWSACESVCSPRESVCSPRGSVCWPPKHHSSKSNTDPSSTATQVRR